MNIFAAILAGGIGSRMGKEIPKQYIKISGKPVIIHTLEAFLRENIFTHIVILTPEDWVSYTEDLISEYIGDNNNVTILKGGDTRNDTLDNALTYLDKEFGFKEDSIIVTHDAVRPFLTSEIIKNNIEAAIECGACGTMVPATDTIVVSDKGIYINDIPNRAKLFQCQTPQTFNAVKLKKIMTSLTEEERNLVTDGCRLFVMKNLPVKMVAGIPENIKITYPFDLVVAEAVLNERKREEN